LSKPVCKLFYYITVMGRSVAVAPMIATIELGAPIPSGFDLSGPFWKRFGHIDINFLGFGILSMVLGTWAIALSVWQLAHVEHQWSAKWKDAGRTG
jgi:high-affinity nickel-transport protein